MEEKGVKREHENGWKTGKVMVIEKRMRRNGSLRKARGKRGGRKNIMGQ